MIYYRALRALRLLALELPPPLAPLVGRQFKCDEHFFETNHNPPPPNPKRAFGDAPPKRAFGAEKLGLPSANPEP